MKQLLSAIGCGLLMSITGTTYASTGNAPAFVNGHNQTITLCNSAGSTSLNSYLAAYEEDLGQTITWSVITAPAHGTASISYTTTSTGDTLDVTGTSYTPASGFSGIDTLVVRVDDGFLADTTIFYITVDGMPDAGSITAPGIMCYGSSAAISASVTGGMWTTTNSNVTLGGGMATAANAGADTIYYTVANTCGADTSLAVVTVEDSLTTSGIISGTLVGCAGASLTFTATMSDGVWSHTATTGSITPDGIVTLGTGATDTVIYTRSNSCNTMAAWAPLTITPMPDAGTISGYDSVCQGSAIVLTTTGTGGTWSSSIPDFAGVDATGTVHGYLNGSTTITYTASNACGTATTTHDVRVNIPALPIVGANTVCQLNVTILANPVTGGTWSSSDFLTAVVFNGTVFGLQLGICEITYTVNNACGESSATMEMEVIDCSATGVETIAAGTATVAPNPSNGTFSVTIPGNGQPTSVNITNVLGQTVAQQQVITGQAVTMALDIPAGVYTLSTTANGLPYATRIVIQH